jgi:hypothetical protein
MDSISVTFGLQLLRRAGISPLRAATSPSPRSRREAVPDGTGDREADVTTPRTVPPLCHADIGSGLRALDAWLGMRPDESASREFLRELWRTPFTPADTFRSAMVEHFALKGWVPCHAAAFGDGRVVLAPGASGSGKSTLATILAREGFEVSDELVFLREDGDRIIAATAPLPLSVAAGTLELLPFAESWRLGTRRMSDGGDEKIFLLPPRPLAGEREVVGVVIRRRDCAERTTSLVTASPSEAVRGMLENTYRFLAAGPRFIEARRRAWRIIASLVGRIPCFLLKGDILAGGGAVEDIARIMRGADRASA